MSNTLMTDKYVCLDRDDGMRQLFTRCLIACNLLYHNIDISPLSNTDLDQDIETRTLVRSLTECIRLVDMTVFTKGVYYFHDIAQRVFDFSSFVCGGHEELSSERPVGESPAAILHHIKSNQITVCFRSVGTLLEWTGPKRVGLVSPASFFDDEKWCGGNVIERYLNLATGYSMSRWKEDQVNREFINHVHGSITEVLLPDICLNLYDQLQSFIDEDFNGDIIFTGHGQAGAVAILCAMKFSIHTKKRPIVVTFGCPPLGDDDFAKSVETWVNHVRIYHESDPIPYILTKFSPIINEGDECPESYGRHGANYHLCISNTSHVVHSVSSPYPESNDIDKTSYHDLSNYSKIFSFQNRPDFWPLCRKP